MSVRIGVDNLVGAILSEDTSTTTTYTEIFPLPGVMKLNINPNASQETLFADDGPADTATTLGKIEVEIDKASLSTTEKGKMLGHGVDANGALVYGDSDTPPWMAIGFRTLKSNGKYRYVWLLKGKFMEPEENNETKGDSINFQNDTIKGQFAKVNKAYTVGGKSVRPWKMEIDEEDTGENIPNAIKKWFTKPYLPGDTVTG